MIVWGKKKLLRNIQKVTQTYFIKYLAKLKASCSRRVKGQIQTSSIFILTIVQEPNLSGGVKLLIDLSSCDQVLFRTLLNVFLQKEFY